MARPTREPKTPNPTERTTASYFDNTGDGGIRCVGAALSLDEQTHIIVCAPDIVALKRAWSHMTTQPLDIKRSQILLYRYGSELEVLQRDQLEEFKEELKTKVSPLKRTGANPHAWLWFIHPESDCCFIDESCRLNMDGNCVELGPAVDCTVEECKLLLRANKVPRGAINKLEINCITDDLIPF